MSLLETLRALIDQRLARLDYHALYPVEIAATNGDGTVEIKSSHPRLAGLSRIAVVGEPGVSRTIDRGAIGHLFFLGGDPRSPRIAGLEAHHLRKLLIEATEKISLLAQTIELAGAGPGVARQGDLVQVGGPTTVVTFLPAPTPKNLATPPPPTMMPGIEYSMIFSKVTDPTPRPSLIGHIATASKRVKAK